MRLFLCLTSGLSYEIRSATDPFFIEEYASATFQLAFDLKFEIRADLPYKQKTLQWIVQLSSGLLWPFAQY
jgi:hypothetical protein